MDLDQGTHITAEINSLLAKTLGHSLKFHTPYQLQPSGQTEHKNPDLKRALGKICQETGFQWPEALHLALIKIQTIPNGRHGSIGFKKTVFGHPLPTDISKPFICGLSEQFDAMTNYTQELINLKQINR